MAQIGRFSNNGGKVLANVKVYLVFWGKRWGAWRLDGGKMMWEKVRDAADAILQYQNPGDYLSGLRQYPFGFQTAELSGSVVDDTTEPKPFNDSADVVGEITKLFGEKPPRLPRPDAPQNAGYDALYLVIMPPGARAKPDQQEAGRHDYDKKNNLYFGWVLSGSEGQASFQRITTGLSEEVVEAITDPEPGSGWVTEVADGTKEELCDVCHGVTEGLKTKDGGEAIVQAIVQTYYYLTSEGKEDCGPPFR